MVLWHWPSVHLVQLAPTTLPQCRLVSNPRSAGLFLSGVSLCALLSVCVCLAHSLSLCLALSLSQCLALLTLPRGFLFLFTLPRGFFFLFTLPTRSLYPSLPSVSASCYTPPCLLAPVRHIAVRMALCSATCRGTVQRLRILGLLA